MAQEQYDMQNARHNYVISLISSVKVNRDVFQDS